MYRPRHLSRHLRTPIRIILLTAFALVGTIPLRAQIDYPDTMKVKRIFGVGDDEFFKGAWIKVRPGSEGVSAATADTSWRQIWELAKVSVGRQLQFYPFTGLDLPPHV